MRIMRLSIVGTAASSLLAAAALTPGVLAADEDWSMADHPFVGTWMIENTPDDPADALELGVHGPAGTIVNIRPEGSNAGAWIPTGERTVEVTIHVPLTDADAGFLGFLTIRGDAEVSEDGQSFTSTYTVEFPTAMVEAAGLPAGQLGPGGGVTAERVNVEPMGETVAPWPLPVPPEEGTTEEEASE